MARKHGDIESGKLGDKIYYTWHGRQCERSMPTHVANPQTPEQQSHRNAFAAISKLSSYMKEAHLIGLHWLSVREHNSTYALFRKLNKDCFTPEGDIDYPRIVVSKGSVPLVTITSASISDGLLSVTFDSHAYDGAATDELYLFIHGDFPVLCLHYLLFLSLYGRSASCCLCCATRCPPGKRGIPGSTRNLRKSVCCGNRKSRIRTDSVRVRRI